MLPSRLPRPIRLSLFALAVAILFLLCVLPSDTLPDPGTGDRFEHSAAWFVLTATGYLLAPRRVLAIPTFALAYGVFIEVVQGFVGRDNDLRDVAADAVGVALAVGLFLAARRWRAAR
jgi:hypothetical protein